MQTDNMIHVVSYHETRHMSYLIHEISQALKLSAIYLWKERLIMAKMFRECYIDNCMAGVSLANN
jgi:hypothetical protein